jgi:cytochrome b6-f complex iron-sulfur subunit
MERKEFILKTFAFCGLVLIPVGIIESCSKQSYAGPSNANFTLDLNNAANATLNSVGGSVISNGIIVIRMNLTTFVAFSATCTHAGCTVGYNSGTIVCPCHGGTYNVATGAVISGPPPAALSKYTVTQTGTVLTIKS